MLLSNITLCYCHKSFSVANVTAHRQVLSFLTIILAIVLLRAKPASPLFPFSLQMLVGLPIIRHMRMLRTIPPANTPHLSHSNTYQKPRSPREILFRHLIGANHAVPPKEAPKSARQANSLKTRPISSFHQNTPILLPCQIINNQSSIINGKMPLFLIPDLILFHLHFAP